MTGRYPITVIPCHLGATTRKKASHISNRHWCPSAFPPAVPSGGAESSHRTCLPSPVLRRGGGGVGQAGTWLSGCHRSSDDPSNDAAVCFCVPGPWPLPYPGEKGPLSLLSSVKQNRGSGGAGSLARVSGSRPETESVGKTDVRALSCHDRVFVSFFFSFPNKFPLDREDVFSA